MDYGLGDNSPLGKFNELGGYVLLVGVDYDSNTFFHLSEMRSGIREIFVNGAPILINGKRVWKEFKDIEFDSEDFNKIGEAFEKEFDIKSGKIGLADAKLLNQKRVVDFAEKWFIENN